MAFLKQEHFKLSSVASLFGAAMGEARGYFRAADENSESLDITARQDTQASAASDHSALRRRLKRFQNEHADR